MAKLTEIEQLQKKKKRKQMGKNILVVLIAAAVVCAALYLRNSSDFQEFLGTTILGGTGYQEGEGFPVEFTGVDTISMQQLSGGNLAILNSSKLTVLNTHGGLEREISHQMMNPRAVFGGDRTLLYDFSGKTWQLYSGERLLDSQTLDSPIYAADMVDTGSFVIASGSSQDLSVVTGYTRERSVCFQWRSSNKLVTNLVMDDTGKEIAFTTVSAQDGVLVTNLYVYRFDREEPVAELEFLDEITLSLQYRYNGSLTLLTDRSLSVIGGNGKITGQADFGGEMVSAYADSMNRYTVVVLGDYSNTKSCRVVYYDMRAEENVSFTMNDPIKQIESTATALYIYNERGLFQYGEDGLLRLQLPILNVIGFIPVDSVVYYMTFDGLEKATMERAR